MQFSGNVLFLDRNDINTDEIIPAKYLTEITKAALAPHCLEDLKLGSFNPSQDLADKGVIVTRANFGCGSSREHAPWALEVNGIRLVVAESYARIFRQNMFNGGLVAVTLTAAQLDEIFRLFQNQVTLATADVAAGWIRFEAGSLSQTYSFSLGEFEKALVREGGWVGFAHAHY